MKNMYKKIGKSIGASALALMMLSTPIIQLNSSLAYAAESGSYIKEFIYNKKTITEGEDYVLPGTITAKMSDGTRKYIKVKWDTTVDTSIAGKHMIYGKMDGYTERAKFILTVVHKSDLSKNLVQARKKVDHLTNSLKTNYLGLKNQGTWQKYIGEIRKDISKISNSEKDQKDDLIAEVNRAEALVNALARINQVEKSTTPKSQGGYGNYLGIKNAETWREYLRLAQIDLEKVNKNIFEKQYNELISRMNNVDKLVKKIEYDYQVEYDKVFKLYEEGKNNKDIELLKKAREESRNLGTCKKTMELERKIDGAIYGVGGKPSGSDEIKKVVSILNNSATITEGEKISLPSHITATLEDGKRVYLAVKWNGGVDIYKVGTQVVKGSIETEGYSIQEVDFTLTVKPSKTNTVVKVLDNSATITAGQKFELPKQLKAVMKDGTTQYVNIKWDRNPEVDRFGKQILTGAVVGYLKDVTFILTVKESANIKPNIDIIRKEEELTKEVFKEFNRFRVENGREPLEWDETCASWADKQTKKNASGEGRGHSVDMGWEYGDNVLMRAKDWDIHMTTPKDFINQFAASSGHRANMLQDNYKVAGCSVWSGINDTYHLTIVFK